MAHKGLYGKCKERCCCKEEMTVKHKIAAVSCIVVLILVVLGFGVSILYSDYIYNPNGTLSTLQIGRANDSGYVDPTISAKDKQFLTELDQWALDGQATIIFKDGSTAGGGYCGYSDWEQKNLKITRVSENTNGVYVQNSRTVVEPYVHVGVFLPGRAGLEIAGFYAEDHLPGTVKGIDFLYPLTAATRVDGMYFTDTKDLDALVHFFEEHGYVLLSRRESGTLTLQALAHKLLSDGPLAMAVFVAMAGLIFCFLYVILILYRDIAKPLRIHCLFGLSIKRISVSIVVLSVVVTSVAVLLFGLLLTNGLTYLSRADLRCVLAGACALSVVLVVLAHAIGCGRLFRGLRQGGGV